MALTELAFTLALLAPQEEVQDPRFSSVLTTAEQRKLNELARKWFEEIKEWNEETVPAKRAKAHDKKVRAQEKFMKEWDAKSKKEPIKHVGDLLAVFENVFPYERQTGAGEMRTETKDDVSFDIVVPRGFSNDEKHTTLIVLPDRMDSEWSPNKDHYQQTWKDIESAAEWLVVLPQLEAGQDLDPLPDLSSESGSAAEHGRIASVLAPVGRAQQMYRFDRNRLFLDCGKGSSGFGMRMASYFPTRFAGLILRSPTVFGTVDSNQGHLREHFLFDSLTGLPVLLIKSAATADACTAIASKLNELSPASCEVLEEDDPELKTKIAAWTATKQRDLFRQKVVLAPNHDLFKKSFWVAIDVSESVHGGPDGRPYLVAEADREANRITVTARNVTGFQLMLNDAIVDLDKEFTVVVNGKAVSEKLERSMYKLTEDFLSFNLFDPNRVFTATYRTTVPDTDG